MEEACTNRLTLYMSVWSPYVYFWQVQTVSTRNQDRVREEGVKTVGVHYQESDSPLIYRSYEGSAGTHA